MNHVGDWYVLRNARAGGWSFSVRAAVANRISAHKHAFGRIIPRLVWAAAVLTAIAGAVVGIGVTVAANDPPQDVAAIALAYLLVVSPYVFVARAIDDLTR